MIALLSAALVAQQEPLRVWHAYREAEAKVFAAAVQQHAPGSVVSQIPYDNFQSKLMQALFAGTGPDLFVAPHEHLEDWWRYLDAPATDQSDIAVARDALTVRGALYGHPYALKTLALIRNGALAPEAVDTLEALAPLAPNGGFAVGYDTTSFYFHSPFFFALADRLFDGEALAIDTPAAQKSFAWLRAATREGRFVSKGLDHTQLVSQFRKGAIVALVEGPAALSDLGDLPNLRVQTLPRVNALDALPRPFATIDGLFVVKGAQTARAHALALALQGAEHCEERTRVAKQLPALKKCRETADPALLGPFYDQLEHAVPMPTTKAMGTAWIPLHSMLSFAVHTDEPLAEAAAKVQRHFARLMLPDEAAPWWADAIVLAVALTLGGAALRRSLSRSGRGGQRVAPPGEGKPTVIALLFGPAALFMIAFLLIPLAIGAALAFFAHEDGVFRWVGVGNFLGLLSHGAFYLTLLVTIVWTASNIALHSVLGISLALALDHPRVRFKRWFRALLVLPWAIPNYISALVFHNLFNFELGAINGVLAALGVERVDWFASFATSFAANLTANGWLGFPFVMVVTLGALQGIDKSLIEAMRLDGATAWQRFRHLTLPSIAPMIAPAMILSTIWTFNMFNIIYLVSGGEPRGETEILITEAYRWAFSRGGRYGYAAAYCATIFFILWAMLKLRDRVARRA